MTSTAPHNLYNVIEERWLAPDRLPTSDELDQAVSALDGVAEFLTDPIARGCVTVGNAGEANAVDFEQIGRLVLWADDVRYAVERIAESAEMVSIIARETFPNMARGGDGDGTPYDENTGNLQKGTYYEKLQRRLGFGDA